MADEPEETTAEVTAAASTEAPADTAEAEPITATATPEPVAESVAAPRGGAGARCGAGTRQGGRVDGRGRRAPQPPQGA